MRQREEGLCYIYTKSDGACFAVPRSEYHRLREEWMAGRAFWTGKGFYGSDATIKLADVCGIADTPSEAMAASREDAAEDSREDSIT